MATPQKNHVLILVYSLTGNTHHVATKIATALDSTQKFETKILNIVPLIRSRYFENKTTPTNEDQRENDEFEKSLLWCDVIGCGVLSVAGAPPAGVSQFLSEIPSDRVKGKPAFVFTTAGQMIGNSNKIMGDSLLAAGVAAIVSEGAILPCPDTWVWCLPNSPRKYIWGTKVIETASKLGDDIAEQLAAFFDESGAIKPQWRVKNSKLMTKKVESEKRLGTWLRALAIPSINCEKSKCVKCKVCSRVCPTNSISIEDGGYPVWNKKTCLGCTACVARCPRNALYVRNMKHKQYWVFSQTNVKEGDNNWTRGQMRLWAVKSLVWRLVTSVKFMFALFIIVSLFVAYKKYFI